MEKAENSDVDWGSEPDEENQKLTSGISKLLVDSDLDKPENERLDMLYAFFEKAKANGTIMVGHLIENLIDFFNIL